MSIPAHEAKSRLIEGNKRFINATSNPGDVSLERRVDTLKNGQHPYAIVLCCSDSRQVPEAIFSAVSWWLYLDITIAVQLRRQ